MTSIRLEVLEWATAGKDLLERARKTLSSAPSEIVRQLARRIPVTVLSEDDAVVLVFAGQYSAGKSTILKALTGRKDIVIGAGITTEQTHAYDWEGVKLVDTPGVHTELRPDHDEIAYRAIADADLLVFVITNELFDSHLAQHFRSLAIERDKAHEMMLVVNKMRRCAKGNGPEAQSVILEDLRKVVAPFSPEDLRTTFLDAEAALESEGEADEAIRKAWWRKSGIDPFTQTLNRFVREKGLAGRYTSRLYGLEQVLQEALANEPSGDEDMDGVEELLVQRRRALLEARDHLLRAVEGKVQEAGSHIRREGRAIADMINGSANQSEVDRQLQAAQDRVDRQSAQLEQAIQEVIGKHVSNLEDRVSALTQSELAKQLLLRLASRFRDPRIAPEAVSTLKNASDVSSKLGEFLFRYSFNPNAVNFGGLFSLNQYSGTLTHDAVKAVGNFFGKSFMPWEAVKWTRTIANLGRVFAVAGAVLTFILQIKEDTDAVQVEADLRESRSAVRSGFNDAAQAVEMHYDRATKEYVAGTLTKEISAVDDQLAELREMQQANSDLFRELLSLLEETGTLIRHLHTEGAELWASV